MNPHPSYQFQPGGPGGPGRPKGSVSGRAKAIALIDEIITENADDLRAALLQAFKRNPVAFWTKFGYPLVPQALVAKVETAPSCGPWTSLLEVSRYREIERRAREAGIELPPPARILARNGGPQNEDAASPVPFWPSPKRPPGTELPETTEGAPE